MYTVTNYKTKKALKAAVASGVQVHVYSPGGWPTSSNGIVDLEGPHYPAPHTWYATGVMKDSVVVKVT